MNRPALLLILLLAGATVLADSIQFRSGGKIEGIIVSETATDLTIKTGPGNATFKKSQITSIYRDAPASNAKKEEAWRTADFSNPEFLPAPLRPLANDFRALSDRQSSARSASQKLAQLRAATANDEVEFKQLEQRRAAIVLKLPDQTSQAEVAAYNKLVQTSNELVMRMNAINQQRSQLDAAETAARSSFSAYISALNKFRSDLDTARVKNPPDAQSKLFFEKASQSLALHASGIEETRIPITDARGGHAMVTARINDRHDAKLLVDTGATYVALPLATAKRMNLEWDKKKKSSAILADGSATDVYPVTIRRLTVAGATLENVQAVVMPDATGFNNDGLLGMSFLREFDVQIDSAGSEIKLRRLPPAK